MRSAADPCMATLLLAAAVPPRWRRPETSWSCSIRLYNSHTTRSTTLDDGASNWRTSLLRAGNWYSRRRQLDGRSADDIMFLKVPGIT
jgi:hypothetical protein